MSSLSDGGSVAGRIDLSSDELGIFHPEAIDSYAASVAVDDSGEVSVFANGFVTRWDGTTLSKLDDGLLPSALAGSAPSDANGRVAVEGGGVNNSFVLFDGDHAELVDLGAPNGVFWQFMPLGWFGDRVLARTDAEDGRGGELRLIPLDGGPGAKVGVADTGTQESLTVAYRLLDAEHLTAERPKPDWPWSEERWAITIGLGAAAAIALLMGLRWGRRRYRSAT